jgi:aminobenzoyl-glutamate utilization protein B
MRRLLMRKLSPVSLSLHSKIRLLLQVVAVAAVPTATAAAQGASSSHAQLMQLVEQNAAHWQQVSKQIWDYAELGYHETKSSELLQEQLKAAGFRVQAGVAEEPTAFIASYGEGKPVVAILGEFDALPGLSQQTVPTRDPVKAGAPGHGCGHNLLGAGAALAAVSLKQYMESHHAPGTLRYYGTPAEEGGSGKV